MWASFPILPSVSMACRMGLGLSGYVMQGAGESAAGDDAASAADALREPAAREWHEPVMAETVLEWLNPRPGQTVVDGTAGTGGHSLSMLPRLLPGGKLLAIDRDRDALDCARERLAAFGPHVEFVQDNFRSLPMVLQRLRLSRVDGILLDLGVSSLQLDRAERGFSFAREGPLDMRMDARQGATAEALVNALPASELAGMMQELGGERFAARIARGIARERCRERITTTRQLAQLVVRAVPSRARHGRLHVATRAFQALRMAVNDELGALQALLDALPTLLAPGGRAVILSYHSLEDRLVKQRFAHGLREGIWTVLTRKPARPMEREIARNPRARSAKLRAVECR